MIYRAGAFVAGGRLGGARIGWEETGLGRTNGIEEPGACHVARGACEGAKVVEGSLNMF